MSISNISSSSSCPYSSVPSFPDKPFSEESYQEAYTELRIKLQTESPDTEENLSSICNHYQTILKEGKLEPPKIRSLRQDFLEFLKKLLGSHPMAERKLLDEVNVLLKTPEIEWNLPSKIEALLIVYNLCPSQRQEIYYILLDLLKKTGLLQEKIPMRNLQELESLLGSAKKSLGGACSCLRTLLYEAISNAPFVLEARQMIDRTLGEESLFYFPKQLQETLYNFREQFQSRFEQQFLKIPLSTIQPEQVRQFQRESYRDFYENVLQTILAFPLQMLGQKRMQTELHVYGSIAREELVPFTDLEMIFLLEENDRLEPNGRFLRSIIEWIGIQVSAIGESPLTLPKELLPLIDQTSPKGLSLDLTPNLAIPPLRAMNDCSPICMTTLSILCKFQKEKQLIEELEKEFDIAAHTSDERRKDSREHRLKQILEGTNHPEARREISVLLENLNTPQFESLLNELKSRASEQSAPVSLAALRQKLKEFEEQNERDLDLALKEHQVREQALQKLSEEITNAETQKLLFSLLKTKKIGASSGAEFSYEEKRSHVLDEPLDGKSRREQKALSKIDQLDGVKEIDKILQTMLNIKDDFIIPIFYPFVPLAVYHGIESTNTLDIIEELAEKNLISELSKSLLQQAVAAIYIMRARLHFQFQTSPWEGSYDEMRRLQNHPNTLSDDEQKVLDTAYWMVQRPLHEYLRLFKEENSSVKTMDLEALALDLFKKEVSSIDSQALLVHRYRSFIKSYASYLVDFRAPSEKHLDFYKFLSTRPIYEPLRKIYVDILEEKIIPSREENPSAIDFESLLLKLFEEEVASSDSQDSFAKRFFPFIDRYVDYLVDCQAHLKKHLNFYKFLSTSSFYEPLRKIYLDALEKKAVNEIVGILGEIPNRDGYRQSYRMAYKELLARIEELSLPEDQNSSYKGIEVVLDVPELGKRKLKPEWIPNLFDMATGGLNPIPPETNQPEYSNCRHKVRSVPGLDLHMKERPNHPVMEYAVGNLIHRLFPSGPPATQLVRVTVSGKESYPILFSATVLGNVFDPERDRIDPAQLTELLISQVLLLPGDADARNFIFSNSILRCIDNDVNFVDPIVRSGIFRRVQLTSILFCLNQPLILNKQVIERFCNLDPLFILNGWLEDVIQREKIYGALFPEVRERQRLSLENSTEESFTPFFLIGPGSIARLYEQIVKLQSIFREQAERKWRPLDLLAEIIGRSDRADLDSSAIGPHIKDAYEKAFSAASSAVDRLRLAVARNISRSLTSSEVFEAQFGRIPSVEEFEKREAFSPEQALQELFAFDLESCTNLGIIIHGKEKKIFKSAFEKMVKDGKPDLERQQLVLSCLLRNQSLLKMKVLNLSHCVALDQVQLESVIHKFPDLEVLDLRCCPLITSESVQQIASLKNLRELYISGCSALTALEANSGFVFFRTPAPLIFPKLILLHAEQCSLNYLNIRAHQLVELKINQPLPLTIQMLDAPLLERLHCSDLINPRSLSGLKALKTLHLENCHTMTDQNVVQILGQNLALKKLILKSCFKISKLPDHRCLQALSVTAAPLIAIKGAYPALTDLHCEDCGELEKIILPEAPVVKLVAKNCSHLKFLQGNPDRLEDLSLEASLQLTFYRNSLFAYKHLKKLNLSSNRILKEEIQKIPSELPLLEELRLNRCDFSDQAVIFADPFPGLKILQMQNTHLRSLLIKGDHLLEMDLNHHSSNNFFWQQGSFEVPILKRANLKGLYYRDPQQLGCLPKNATKMVSFILEKDTDLEKLAFLFQKTANIQMLLTVEKGVSLEKLLEFVRRFSGQVTRLDLRGNKIGDEGAKAIAAFLPQSHLTELNLEANSIRAEGAKAIAAALSQSQLTELNLGANSIGDEGTKAVAVSLPQSQLTELNLRNNSIGDEGTKAIAVSLSQSHLIELNLESNLIEKGANVIAAALPQSQLTELNLRNNSIGNEGTKAIAAALPQSQLTRLNLGLNSVRKKGANAIAAALPQSQLTELNLRDNSIGDEGVKAIVTSLPQSHLIELNLGLNLVRDEGARTLENARKLYPFKRILS